MIVCPVCGTKNLATADFCTNCNAYLGWDRNQQSQQGEGSLSEQHGSSGQQPPLIPQPGDSAAQQAGALVAARSDVQPTRRPRRPDTAGVGQSASADRDGTAQLGTPIEDTAPIEETAREEAGTAELPALPGRPAPEVANRSAAGLVKPGAPGPVKPGDRVFVPPPPAPAPVARPAPGELICPNCGTGNEPHRNFCRKCAHALVDPDSDAVVAPRRSWWKQLFGPQPPAARPAGSRPRRPLRFPTRTMALLVILGLVGGAGYVFRAPIGWAITRAQDELGKSQVWPESSTASVSEAGRGPELTWDRNTRTWWETRGAGDYLQVTFARPVRLVNVGVTLGAAEGRPVRLRLIPTDSDGVPGEPRVVDLKDAPGFQHFYVGVDDVKQLQMEIVTVSPAGSARVAIVEVEYYARTGTAPDTTPDTTPPQ